jgi:hypothetical protein
MINNENGDSLIGVYKRCLRIGLEMARRGHEVSMFCTGRDAYRDAAVSEAEAVMHFVDFPLNVLFCPCVEVRRRFYRKVFNRVAPSLVVIGEAPLAGTLLDSTLCAAGLGIPVVVLDNAYSPALAAAFIDSHGPMVDGVILTGATSFHVPDPPSFYCAAPPFISGCGKEADSLLDELGIGSRKLITILGYERKAEILAAALLAARPREDVLALFVVPNPLETHERMASLPHAVLERVRLIRPPEEAVLFSLLARSALAIGKCGFMQVSESLALGTPFIGLHYRGCFDVDMFDSCARNFVHKTTSIEPEPDTLEAFDRFLDLGSGQMHHIHHWGFAGLTQAANFIENLPQAPRSETNGETERLGYTRAIITKSLTSLHPNSGVELQWSRATRLRNYPQCLIDSVTVGYKVGERRRQAFLWGRRYSDERSADYDRDLAEDPNSARRILFQSEDKLLILELDAGESRLPPLII